MNHNKWWSLVPILAAGLFLLVVNEKASAVDSSVVGTVQKAGGTVNIVRQGETMNAKVGLELWQNDTIRTGPDGSVGVLFKDDTSLSLGPDSALVIDEFVFAPHQGKFSIVVKMLKGTAVYISGLASRFEPDSTRFETPSASLGIRGTKFVVKVEEK